MKYFSTQLSSCLFCAELFPYGQPRMVSLSNLQQKMPLVSLEECSYWGAVSFPERYSNVNTRVKQTTRAILERHPEESLLLVGHGLSVEYMVSFTPGCALQQSNH